MTILADGLSMTLDTKKFKSLLTEVIAVPLILMGLLACILLWQMSHLMSIARLIEQTNKVISLAQTTEKLLLDTQTGLRGYLISGSPGYLDPYSHSGPQVEPAIRSLTALLSDNPIQIRRLDAFTSLYRQWGEYGRKTIEMKSKGGPYQTDAVTAQGEELMDAMRLHLSFFSKTEEDLLKVQSREIEAATRNTVTVLLGLAILLGASLAFFFRRQILAVSRTYETALLEAERQTNAFRESEQRYRTLVDFLPDAILVHRDETWLFANSSATRLFAARSPEELVGSSILTTVHSEFHETVRQRVNDVMSGRQTSLIELKLLRLDGTVFSAEASGTAFSYEGAPAGLTVIRDVTSRKRLEEQLMQAGKMEAIGRLAGGIAHDFNNLLSVIIGFSQVTLEDLDEGNPIRKDIEEIEKCAKRAGDLTGQLLAFGRKQMLNPQALDMVEVVNGLEKLLRRIIGEDVELLISGSPQPCHVRADKVQLEQVIMNLAINAKDAMPRGGKLLIEVQTVNLDDSVKSKGDLIAPGPYVVLSVSDSGIGMDAETQNRIFEPFFTTKELGKGTGLGLATVYGIVKQSSGYIWVYSEVGRGTTFKVYLPRASSSDLDSKPATVKPSVLHQGTKTILLVEDEEAVRSVAARALTRHGYRVIAASNGKEASEIAELYESDEIHLLLTDVIMPGMSGKEVSDWFRAARPSVKVLFVSGYTDAAIVQHGVLDPDIAFLNKPFTPEGLIRKVQEVLEEA